MKKKSFSFKNINVINIVIFIILALYTLSVFSILAWAILTSLKSTLDFTDMGNVLGLPDWNLSAEEIKLGNYTSILEKFITPTDSKNYYSAIWGEIQRPQLNVDLFGMLFNTFLYAGVGNLVYTFVSMTMGYMCAKYKYKFSSFLYILMVVVMALPIVGSQPAELAMMKDLGIYDSVVGMMAHKINFTGMYFLVFYAFFVGFSDTYLEAAQIDGASQFYSFLHIVVPLSAKLMGTVFLITFIGSWNDYQTPLLYYPSYPTIAYGVFRMSSNTIFGDSLTQGVPARVAASMLLAIPTMVVFVIFRNVVMGDLSLGGLKE